MSSFAFRKVFQFGTMEIAHYFPGHMSRGYIQMQKRLKDVDCILEVHDARIPLTGRNPLFSDTTQLRPHILILNKMDLSDMRKRGSIESKLKEGGVTNVLYTNCKAQVHNSVKKQIMPCVLDIMKDVPRFHRADADSINILVIGVPNVGKSSLINALRRLYIKKGKATRVGAEAGITKSVLEKIKISESPPVYVYDSPGILNPRIIDVEEGMKLAICATLKDHLVGEDLMADYILYWLNKHELFRYVKHFNLEEPTDNVQELLAKIALDNNHISKRKTPQGTYELRPDFMHAAKVMVRAFRDGHLGKINLDRDALPDHVT